MAVLDEAQAIKNADTRRAEASAAPERRVSARADRHAGRERPRRAVEPVRLRQPGPARAGATRFARRFVDADRARRRRAGAEPRCAALVRPFLLRRTKARGARRTAAAHRADAARRAGRRGARLLRGAAPTRARASATKPGRERTRIQILAEITRLRLACCHPRLAAPGLRHRPPAKLRGVPRARRASCGEGATARSCSASSSPPDAGARGARRATAQAYQYLDGATPAARAREAGGGVPGGRGRPVPDQPQGRRHRPQPHRRRLRDPPRSVVEPGGRGLRPPTAPTASARTAR